MVTGGRQHGRLATGQVRIASRGISMQDVCPRGRVRLPAGDGEGQ
jgi:hypothetical protein